METCESTDKSPLSQSNIPLDARRLLYAISLYAKDPEGNLWLKDFSVSVIAHLGSVAGVFDRYDIAPALYEFRGVKTFAQISQEAIDDVDLLFHYQLIEKIILNTRFYTTTTGIRLSKKGIQILSHPDTLSDDDRSSIKQLLQCPICGNLLDFAVYREKEPSVNLMVLRICTCQSHGDTYRKEDFCQQFLMQGENVETFFSLGDVAYRSRPFFLGGEYEK